MKWIQANVGPTIQMIAVDEVLFFVSDEKYTRVQTAQVEALIRKPIKELVDELDPQQFWQIHRSTLVNVKAIAGVTRDFRGRQIVSVRGHPEKLEVSRSYTGLVQGHVGTPLTPAWGSADPRSDGWQPRPASGTMRAQGNTAGAR
jgi:DNA-binding LytR/AlgR family response regulator